MAVAQNRLPGEGVYGPVEALTLQVLREELDKLRGTLSDDILMNHDRCVSICDEFIDELGQCINLSVEKYPEDKELYGRVFDGLQEIINLVHGDKSGLLGSDGKPRLMDPQESRMSASDRLMEIMEELAFEVSRREVINEKARMEKAASSGEPRRRQREGAPPS